MDRPFAIAQMPDLSDVNDRPQLANIVALP